MKERDGMTGGIAEYLCERFRAHGAQTVSNATHRAVGVNCLQVEVSGRVRTTNEGLEKFCAGFKTIPSTCLIQY